MRAGFSRLKEVNMNEFGEVEMWTRIKYSSVKATMQTVTLRSAIQNHSEANLMPQVPLSRVVRENA